MLGKIFKKFWVTLKSSISLIIVYNFSTIVNCTTSMWKETCGVEDLQYVDPKIHNCFILMLDMLPSLYLLYPCSFTRYCTTIWWTALQILNQRMTGWKTTYKLQCRKLKYHSDHACLQTARNIKLQPITYLGKWTTGNLQLTALHLQSTFYSILRVLYEVVAGITTDTKPLFHKTLMLCETR